jgi:hypothetical protein
LVVFSRLRKDADLRNVPSAKRRRGHLQSREKAQTRCRNDRAIWEIRVKSRRDSLRWNSSPAKV